MRTISVCLLCASAVAVPAAGQEPAAYSRADLIAALERLMITGEPHQTSVDDGQLLQLAVDDAIRSGDQEVERLAVRAAAPLFAVSKPLIEVGRPASIGIGNRQVLKVPRPVPFEAVIYISVDDQDYETAGTLTSSKGSSVSTKLNEAALLPGVHRVRVRAQLRFGGPQTPRWTEVRQLPEVSYAVYDRQAPGSGAAPLLLAPATTSGAALDQNLPDVPLGAWLAEVLKRAEAKRPVEWLTHYCVERTRKTTVSPPAGGGDLCAVAWFEAKGDIFRAWFRTGSLRFSEGGPVWTVDRPSFEGIDSSGSGTALTTLSALPALLDKPRESWPIGDVAIAATDIIVETPRPDWAVVTVTVRNNGPVAVHRAQVLVSVGSDPASRVMPRILTVDVPGHGSADIRVGTRLPAPYGFVVAQAIQISDMSPHDTWTFDPTPLDACAFRLVNAHLAPAEYVRAIDKSSGCVGW